MNRGISITQYHTSHPWKSRGLLCPCLGQEGRDWGCHTQTLYPHNSGYLDLAAHFGKCSRSAHLSRSNSHFELVPSIQDSHRSWKEKNYWIRKENNANFKRKTSTFQLHLQHSGASADWTEGQAATTPVLHSREITCCVPEEYPKVQLPLCFEYLLMFCAHPGVRAPSLECTLCVSEAG